MTATVSIFDPSREDRRPYDGPTTDELHLFIHQVVARKVHEVIQGAWEDYHWRHRLSGPSGNLTAIEQWLCEHVFDMAIYDAGCEEEEDESA